MLRGQDLGYDSEVKAYLTAWSMNGAFLILAAFTDEHVKAAKAMGSSLNRSREEHDIKCLAAVGVVFENPQPDEKDERFVSMEYT